MNKNSDFESRKQDHIKLSLSSKTQNLTASHFDHVRLAHEALPLANFSDVQLTSVLLGHEFNSPHFVSSMTAGHKNAGVINRALAVACEEQGWLFALGSQKAELSQSLAQAKKEWQVLHKEAAHLKCLSNIGIEEVVLNPVDEIYRLCESVKAIGLIVHLNPLQEVFQNKEDVYFGQSYTALQKLIKNSPVPVVIKEVGFGISVETAKKLWAMGAKVVDVAGKGGTHWAMIEALRQPQDSMLRNSVQAFTDWGFSTLECLESLKLDGVKQDYWASGGIRSGVDSAKCLALGAKAVGIAQPLMKAAVSSTSMDKKIGSIIKVMQQYDFELKTAMFCSGAVNISDMKNKKVLYGK